METIAFKVLREDLSSLQLLGAPKYLYKPDKVNKPQEPLSQHPRKGGGLWVAPNLSSARGMVRYMKNKYGVATRIFRCRIGKVLHRTSCRIKTDTLFFTLDDEIPYVP